jgi:hypothetical protein
VTLGGEMAKAVAPSLDRAQIILDTETASTTVDQLGHIALPPQRRRHAEMRLRLGSVP